ncbi:MAG: DNA repair protein [Ruminococcaceae bacterium]|nr:DNA repair protein [Oscillospiraceae bacterium]
MITAAWIIPAAVFTFLSLERLFNIRRRCHRLSKLYLCIDLKSFYASVECTERGLDPMTTNLIVADPERTDKTICLAVTPAMKKLGIKNRCRVFEIPKSIEYITAPPRMQLYIDYAARIYGVYLKYVSKDDIYVYSIDEVFMDVTHYLPLYQMSAKELAQTILQDMYEQIGVRASCGIGTNLYLTKIALDITAKHAEDFIGFLDEEKYKRTLWKHKPLTDFWRIGAGTARRLLKYGIDTMEGIAKADEDFLYRLFGVDAELLIDHAWGIEPTTIADIKRYKPKTNSLTSGQVLMADYDFEDGRLIVEEMMEDMCLSMLDKGLVTKSVTLRVGYSNSLHMDAAHGTVSVARETNASSIWIPEVLALYDRIVNRECPVRRIHIFSNKVTEEGVYQTSFLEDDEEEKRNRKMQETVLEIKKHFGKNAVFKGIDLKENATALERNRQIGGHKSGEEQ